MKKNIVTEPCCSLGIDGVQQETLVSMFKALGNPIRFQILKFLLTHPGCITADIVSSLPVAQATGETSTATEKAQSRLTHRFASV